MALRGSWKSSKVLTRRSWGLLKANPYLFAFPIIGVLLTVIPLAVFGVPALYFLNSNNNWIAAAFGIALIFGVQAFIVFPAAGLVAAVDEEMQGRNASVRLGMSLALARFGPLLAWSGIQTVVSALVGVLRGNNQGSLVGVVFRNIVAAAAGVMWDLITFFVLPVMIIEKASPIDAIKTSSSLFKKQWGTQLAGGVRIGGFIPLILVVPGVLIMIGGIALVSVENSTTLVAGLTMAAIGFLIIMMGALVIAAMRGIYSVALYRYAKDGELLGGFTSQELQASVRVKS